MCECVIHVHLVSALWYIYRYESLYRIGKIERKKKSLKLKKRRSIVFYFIFSSTNRQAVRLDTIDCPGSAATPLKMYEENDDEMMNKR